MSAKTNDILREVQRSANIGIHSFSVSDTKRIFSSCLNEQWISHLSWVGGEMATRYFILA